MSQLPRRVVCTGVGMVSPLGVGVSKSWSALLQAKSGISRLKKEHSFEGGKSLVAAYVPDDQLKETLEDPRQNYMSKNAKQLSRATTFAMVAAHQALEDSKLLNNIDDSIESRFRERCGVAIGQGMVDFVDIYENGQLVCGVGDKKRNYRKMSPYFMTRALINMSAGNISIRYRLHGPNHCVSTACATGAHSLGDAFNFIRYNKADIMVCGSTEASINSIAMAGFERLRALSTQFNDKPAEASRPFDKKRCGFVMGEGAGVVILEELEHAKTRGLTDSDIYCEILGYGTSADAHHLTAPLPDGGGAKRSMISALEDSKLDRSLVGHVNAHATSTPLGDDIECNAIEDLFYHETENRSPNDLTVTSCKAAIGHLLGGAGSVESIFAMLSCKERLIPHCLNLDMPLDTQKNMIKLVRMQPHQWDSDNRVLIKNSFGFGGTNASIIMSNLRV